MTYVVTDNCRGCRFTDCVEVCPVECFYADGEMLYIHPEECIDCAACVPECPVEAIYEEDDVPADKTPWIAANAEKCASGKLEHITGKEEPLPGALERKKALGF